MDLTESHRLVYLGRGCQNYLIEPTLLILILDASPSLLDSRPSPHIETRNVDLGPDNPPPLKPVRSTDRQAIDLELRSLQLEFPFMSQLLNHSLGAGMDQRFFWSHHFFGWHAVWPLVAQQFARWGCIDGCINMCAHGIGDLR